MNITAIGTFSAIVLVVSRLSAAPPPDPEAEKLLIGSWVVPLNQYGPAAKDGGFTFRDDGTFSSFSVFRVHGEDLRIDLEGKWSIKNGILIEEITKSSRPEIIPAGLITRDTLSSITDKEYRYRTEQGMEHSRVRK